MWFDLSPKTNGNFTLLNKLKQKPEFLNVVYNGREILCVLSFG
jgi:hypothetical protein